MIHQMVSEGTGISDGCALEALSPFWKKVEPQSICASQCKTGHDLLRARACWPLEEIQPYDEHVC